MYSTFSGATSFNGNLSGWNTSKVESMGDIFVNAFSFTGIGLETWDTSNVRFLTAAFAYRQ